MGFTLRGGGSGSAELIRLTYSSPGVLNASGINGFQILTGKWQRADTEGGSATDIVGATSTSYTLTLADAGKFLNFVALTFNFASGQIASTLVQYGASGTIFPPTTAGGLIE